MSAFLEAMHRVLTVQSNSKETLITIFTNALLFFLIFGMSGTVEVKTLCTQLQNKKAIFTGVLMQFVLMPFLGFLAVSILKNHGLTPSMGITLLIITASPGGSYSNWWCSLFNADLALSVTMTAISTILSIAFLPVNLMIYAHATYGFNSDDEFNPLKSVDFGALFISLGIVIGAILTGMLTSHMAQSEKLRRVSNKLGSFAGLALVLISIFFSTANGSGEKSKPWQQHWSFYIGVGLPCIGGLVVANMFAKVMQLEKPEVVTLSVECCYQNVGIATSVVLAMFEGEAAAEAMAIPLVYGIMEAVVLGLYCFVAWKLGWTNAPHDDKLCKVLVECYQSFDEEEAQQGGSKENERSSSSLRLSKQCTSSQRLRLDTDDTALSAINSSSGFKRNSAESSLFQIVSDESI